jgi:hypothetical protein
VQTFFATQLMAGRPSASFTPPVSNAGDGTGSVVLRLILSRNPGEDGAVSVRQLAADGTTQVTLGTINGSDCELLFQTAPTGTVSLLSTGSSIFGTAVTSLDVR